MSRTPVWSPVTASATPVGRPVFATVGIRTTGIQPDRDRVREIAVVRLDERGAVVDEWTMMPDPDSGFTDVAYVLRERLARMALVAHHPTHTSEVLRVEYARAGWDLPALATVSTFQASFHYLPHLTRRRLADCCSAATVPFMDVRSALGEARALAGLMERYLSGGWEVPVLQELAHVPVYAWVVPWPHEPVRHAIPQSLLAKPFTPELGEDGRPWTVSARLSHQMAGLDLAGSVAPGGSAAHAYAELLAEAVMDGRLVRPGAAGADDVARAFRLEPAQAAQIRRNLVVAMVQRAIHDDEYSQEERQDLYAASRLLDVGEDVVLNLIRQATPLEFPPLEEEGSHVPISTEGSRPSQIRAWAAANGYDIEPHEKIPWSVVRRFDEAFEAQQARVQAHLQAQAQYQSGGRHWG
ncbi:hypothetical protein [Antribacter gilvus]|uniref:hypothetical protein n=1 Tax=Antribacter gilvus TaxID=2304675 RepID=UPI000F7ABB0F|nr:hypothetical protein [Antribacter gilvus]